MDIAPLETFAAEGQSQVFRFFDHLTPEEQAALLAQAAAIDFAELNRLVATLVRGGDGHGRDVTALQPAPYIPLPAHGGDAAAWEKARAEGETALRAGRVAAFTVAGGQGTRLGFDGPKGTFPVTPVRSHSLFQVFAEKILAASRRYESAIPWYIMTSVINHEETLAFFTEHDFFGLDPANVTFFSQGLMPAVDFEGKILLASKQEIALSPDGHGGSLRALVRNGCIDDMKRRGVDLISYFQVDNPLVRCIDPAFLGFHLQNQSELSSKACLKAYPEEKVGVFVRDGDRAEVLEYSDMPDSMMQAVESDGVLRYRAGSIAIHIFSRDLVERIGSGTDPEASLPFHRATKKVPTVDSEGNSLNPDAPNGIKFEMFVFDALPFAKSPVIIETAREDDFSPVKNAEGLDSPETARQDQLRQFARWAKAAGMSLETDATGLPAFDFEVGPLFADSAEAFAARASGIELKPGAVLDLA